MASSAERRLVELGIELPEVFGERGRHARATVGAGSLPGNVPVEVEAVVEVR